MGSPIRAIDPAGRRNRQSGFTYLMLLLWVVLAGAMLAALGTAWSTMAQRERESELLWRGEQIKLALESYRKAGVQLQAQQAKLVPAASTPQGGSSPSNGRTSSNLPGSSFDLSNSKLISEAQANGPGGAQDQADPAALSERNASGAAMGLQQIPGGPLQLEELTQDQRSGKVVRHLRQVYLDPVTRGPWGVIRGKDGRIKGVYSRSEDAPLRSTLGVAQYRDLVFGMDGAATAPPPASQPKPSKSGSLFASPR
jgi:type II secretory pathway pseudopilin PulG